jgi:hypothetical protein
MILRSLIGQPLICQDPRGPTPIDLSSLKRLDAYFAIFRGKADLSRFKRCPTRIDLSSLTRLDSYFASFKSQRFAEIQTSGKADL